jgi:hypothetical protein
MRSGWQQAPAQGDQRREPFGPEVSWPTGYYDLDPYQGQSSGRQAGEMPYGEHPYAAGGQQVQGVDEFGYGDPGYSDPRYEGPGYSDPYVDQGRLGNQWSGAYPTLPGAANDPRYDDPRLDAFTGAFSTNDYPDEFSNTNTPPAGLAYGNATSYDMPVHGGPGYGPGNGGGPVLGAQTRFDMPVYDAPAYGQPSYDEPAFGAPAYGEPQFGQQQYGQPQYGQQQYGEQQYAEPGFDAPQFEAPRHDETRYDMPAYPQPDAYAGGYDQPGGYDQYGPADAFNEPSGPALGAQTRFDMPVLGAPVMESAGFDVDVYRDPEFPDYATGTGPQPVATLPPGFDQPPTRREQVLPHTGMMMAIPTGQLALPARQLPDSFDGGILEKTGAFDAVLDGGPADTMLDMQGASFLRDAAQAVQEDTRIQPIAPPPLKRTGKRRSGSRDRRQWMAIGAIVVVAAGAVAGVVKLAFPGHGASHTMVTPTAVADYTSKPQLEQQMNVPSLVDKVRQMSNGQATDLVSAVYQSGSVSPGSSAQIFLFIGGHLNNADPSSSISSFEQQYPSAKVVSAGAMGGEAACVEVSAGSSGNAAECIWFDNDSFGQMVSSTMNTTQLAQVMRMVRPDVEHVVK